MSNKLMIIIIIICIASLIFVVIDNKRQSNNFEEVLDSQYALNKLLTERLTLTRESLDLSLEFNKLMQENPQDKKRMQENLLKRISLNKEILKTGEQILSILED